jgi:hypothetical protein
LPSKYSTSRTKELLQTEKAKSFFVSLQVKLAMLPMASVPLYQGAGKNFTPELIGTGFAIHLGAHKMLITAGHVADCLTNKQFYVPNSGELKPFNCVIRRIGHSGVSRDQDPIDLAVIDLDEDQAAQLSAYHFIQLDEIEYETFLHDPVGHYAFMGYPASKNKGKYKTDKIAPHLNPYVGVPIPIEDHVKLDRPHMTHLAIPLDKNSTIGLDGSVATPPAPNGISGCPVWTLGAIPEIVYGSRKPLFAGVGFLLRFGRG